MSHRLKADPEPWNKQETWINTTTWTVCFTNIASQTGKKIHLKWWTIKLSNLASVQITTVNPFI